MKKIAIFGAGGFGREVQILIDQINESQPEWNFIGFFDDRLKKGDTVNDFKVLGGINEVNQFDEDLFIVVALGHPPIKKKVVESIWNQKINFPILIHPNVLIGPMKFNSIGEGTVITAGCIITVNTKIGKHVTLNLACTLGHDSIIGDYCSFMPSVNISGDVIIGNEVFVGTGTKIINQVKIGEYTIIGAGAVVSKNIPNNCTAVGIPAKPIKFHE